MFLISRTFNKNKMSFLHDLKAKEKSNVFEIFLGSLSVDKDENLFDCALAEKP
jgi:hypothetical protein